jgi:hypothetical protein
VLFEAAGDVAAAGLLARVASTGAFSSVSAINVLTVEEALDVFSRGAGLQYRARARLSKQIRGRPACSSWRRSGRFGA